MADTCWYAQPQKWSKLKNFFVILLFEHPKLDQILVDVGFVIVVLGLVVLIFDAAK